MVLVQEGDRFYLVIAQRVDNEVSFNCVDGPFPGRNGARLACGRVSPDMQPLRTSRFDLRGLYARHLSKPAPTWMFART